MILCPDCPDLPNGTRKRQICCRREGAVVEREFKHVGQVGPGERVCEKCKGNGQIDRRIPAGQFMAGHFQPCEKCAATGVLPLRLKKGDTVPHVPPALDIRPTFTGSGSTSFKPARHANRGPGR
jgi:hypothetical protein